MIYIVSGLPRSGTSLMMQILKGLGFPLLVDNKRKKDSFNKNGYFEYEDVKLLLKNNNKFLKKAEGKAIKIISYLLPYLPDNHEYCIIFMQRNLNEIVSSQNRMLKNKNNIMDNSITIDEYKKHMRQITNFIESKSNMKSIFIQFKNILNKDTKEVIKIKNIIKNFDETIFFKPVNLSYITSTKL